MANSDIPELLSEREAARRLSVCAATLRRARQRGDLSFLRVGDRVLYSPSQLADFLEKCARRSVA